ncbi:MAG TPA: GNAT family N-acetyltransferase [Chryseosolibacter sp.]
MILFETERLLLREMLPEDYDDLFSMNSDPDVMRYMGDGSVRSREQTMAELERLLSYYVRRPGLGLWATLLKDSYQFVGASGLVYYDDTLNIGLTFLFAKEHWNNGYATEVSQALLKYGFEKLGLQKIVCRASVDNKAAVAVMEKIGMRQVENRAAGERIQVYYELDRKRYKAAGHP